MNERLLELAIEARKYAESRPAYQVAYDKKFAELIVKECVNMCNDIADPHLYRNQDICQRLAPGASYAAKVIKFRFGVEE